ncbi:MAG: GntR family transcriptional regulator [Verrucomicrobia bacterium]|nr:GntR family transcriptional regulator [Verrucomicrobiota bacterium]
MWLQLNFKSGKPVYLQMVEQVKTAVAAGTLRPGDALPSIRPLAEQLRVNRNTVAKAYAELEGQGVIETLAGKGCFVRNHAASPYRKQAREEMLAVDLDAAVVQAHHLQVSRQEFLDLAEARYDRLARQRAAAPFAQKPA